MESINPASVHSPADSSIWPSNAQARGDSLAQSPAGIMSADKMPQQFVSLDPMEVVDDEPSEVRKWPAWKKRLLFLALISSSILCDGYVTHALPCSMLT
jgi:hypothetical protein